MQKDNSNSNSNSMQLKFKALSANEAFARVAVAAFATQLNPTLAELTEVKTAVSEAVTNSIIHGYEMNGQCEVEITCSMIGRQLTIEIKDTGHGIDDIDKAKEPLYTSKPDMERSGMGFTIMDEFMDGLDIISSPGEGTTIKMLKTFGEASDE